MNRDKFEEEIMAMVNAELADEEDELLETESGLDIDIQRMDRKREAKDSKIVKCKTCGEEQEWYSFGSFPNGTKKWVNEAGLICNGRMCAECNQNRAKVTMRSTRGKRVGEVNS